MRQNQKRTFPTWGIIALVVVLIAAGGLGYVFWSKQHDEKLAQKAVEDYTQALEKQDYSAMSKMVTTASLEKIGYTKEQMIERYENIYGGIGASNIKVSDIKKEKGTDAGNYQVSYTVDMVTSLGQLKKQTYKTTLEKGEDSYQLDWNTALIFPGMAADDKVAVSTTKGKRGELLAKDGKPLATEGKAWQVGLHPVALGEGEERKKNLSAAAEAFGVTAEQLEKVLSADWVTEDSFVPFATISESEDRPELKGIVYQETTARTYPLNEAAAHLTGYVGEVSAEDIEKDPTLSTGDVIGKAGLEKAFDKQLRGKKGGKIAIKDSEGNEKEVLQENRMEDGKDITLTIDADLQQAAFDQLNGQKGSVVFTNPSDGDLLALVSSPSYDVNQMTAGISSEDYQAYADDSDSPFLTRYTARYAPGSTFKTITGAIGLDAGTTKPEDTSKVNGLKWQKDASWGNYFVTRVADVPSVNLEQAYVYSDNIFFAKEALKMGEKTFLAGLDKFIFGEDLKLPMAMKPAQISNDGKLASEALLADTGFGQGQLLISPIQQAAMYSVFANDGKLVYPKLTDDQETAEPKQAVTADAVATVKKDLIQVVENEHGSAHKLADLNLPMAAKTGTAETVEKENGEKETNGFLLTFDAESSRYMMVAMMEDTSSGKVVDTMKPLLAKIDTLIK